MKKQNGQLNLLKQENQKYQQAVKESILKAIEIHQGKIKKLRSEFKRLNEGKHPYYERM